MSDSLLKEQYYCRDMPADYFDLLPAGSVRQKKFPSGTRHNAAWDFLITADEKNGYAALCGELSQPLCVQLYRYDVKTGGIDFLFDFGKEFFVSPREIPPSKIHTSLSELPDGRIIMTTHTTARSPQHPYWLFDSYYEHIHEAYQGSHVLIYNPRDGKVRSLGIPISHDSIYGGCYDRRNHAYFCTTFLKGKLFRIDLDTLQVRDLGQVTEMGSYGIFADHLGGIYTSSRSGHIFRIDADTLEIRDLGRIAAQPEELYRWNFHRVIAHWCEGPDQCWYFTMHFSDKLFRLDPVSGEIAEACSLAPRGSWKKAHPAMQKGHGFDSQGILWFLMSRESANAYPGGALHLYRYDFLHGKDVEYMGMVGNGEHSAAIVCHMHIDHNDVMHFPDGNHGEDMAWMTAIDLKKVYADRKLPRRKSCDVWNYCAFTDGRKYYPGDDFERASGDYFRFRQYMLEDAAWRSANAQSMVQPFPERVYRVWEEMPFSEDHAVKSLRFLADGALEAAVGRYRFILHPDGAIEPRAHGIKAETATAPPLPAEHLLPARAGRRMLAAVTASAKLEDCYLLGSADGVFSLWTPEENTVFALGAVGAQGRVHQIAASADGKVAYAILGDPDDLGHLVRFDRRHGLRDLGRVCRDLPDRVIASDTMLSALAVSSDGSLVAVGGADRLACVYVYCFPAAGNEL